MTTSLSRSLKHRQPHTAMSDLSLDQIPDIDPAHRHAGCYRAAASLAENPPSRNRGIAVLWVLLDDTPCMIQAYPWFAKQEDAVFHFRTHYLDWCRDGYYQLLAAADYGIAFGLIENVLDQILRYASPEVLAATAHAYVTSTDLAVRLLRLAIRTGRADSVAWVADQYPQHSDQFTDLAFARGRKQGSVAVWEVLTARYHLRQ